MQNKKAYECRHHGHIGFTRHSPRDGVNKLLRALPGDQDCLTPSPADNSTGLTPTARRQDHTSSPSATTSRQRFRRVWYPSAEALAKADKAPSSSAPLASTASCPASVTISSRPSVGQDGINIKVIWAFCKSEYFSLRGLTKRKIRSRADFRVELSSVNHRDFLLGQLIKLECNLIEFVFLTTNFSVIRREIMFKIDNLLNNGRVV
jgi:hypothetical protein